MKTKQEQVEELATQISRSCERHDLELREPEIDLIAIDVLSAGYRKTFTSDLASETQKAFKEGYEKGAEEMRKEAKKPIEKFIKYRERQAVKEFAGKLKEEQRKRFEAFGGSGLDEFDIDELLKEYTE